MKQIVLLICLIAGCIPAIASDIELTISNIRCKKGKILIGVYKDNPSFQEDKPFAAYAYSKESVRDGTLVIRIEMKPGTYGIAILDDENNNGEMDYRFLGIPREGFGFSVITGRIFKRPDFRDFCFCFTEEKERMNIRLRYTL